MLGPLTMKPRTRKESTYKEWSDTLGKRIRSWGKTPYDDCGNTAKKDREERRMVKKRSSKESRHIDKKIIEEGMINSFVSRNR